MECWDLYNKDRKKLNKTVKRGEKLKDGEYHLVVNVWIKNSKNEYLITQRAENRSFAFMWECTGGSALSGEESINAAIREAKEELGITIQKESGTLIGSTLRYYENCPDILDVWIFKADINVEDVTIQEEEVNDVMWASAEEIRKLYADGKFEANAFFEEVLDLDNNEEIYYIGFNANNTICNENFFTGSITLYPIKESGNIFYSDKLIEDTKSDKFMEKYKEYIYESVKSIQNKNKNAKFICFNAKIRKLCEEMNDINIIRSNDGKVIDYLNNKFETRELFKNEVPILDYVWLHGSELDYESIKLKFNAETFVVQAETGAGGDTTYLVNSKEDLENIKDKNTRYCISKYLKHTPLNITLIVGDSDIIFLPISTQLILLTDNRFKYVGGDFIHSGQLDINVINKVNEYSARIISKVKDIGYRGILGIDYILCENGDVLFMEINPRFQASSFLISQYLEKYCTSSIAKLHYQALSGKRINKIYIENINNSFVNCNNKLPFDNLEENSIIYNGYFDLNQTSVYRKIFDDSVLTKDEFEQIA